VANGAPLPPLPSLTALRAFEASARLGSLTLAARELFVTQTAVSHQVHKLEDELGYPLFRRLPRRIELTARGRAWSEALSDVFSRLHEAHRRLRVTPRPPRPVVSVSVLPSFASRWLVPRLGRFFEQNPSVDVKVSPTEVLHDFASDEIDVAIRYGSGQYPGLGVEKLIDDAWVLVASPAFMAKRRVQSLGDLARVPIVGDDNLEEALVGPFAAHTVSARSMRVTDSSLVVEAAVRGQGVAFARLSLASDELGSGRLVRVLPRIPKVPTGRSYFLAWVRSGAERPEVRAFRRWVKDEIAPLRRAIAGDAPRRGGTRTGQR